MSLTNDDFKRIESMVTGAITTAITGLPTKAELAGLATKADLDHAVSGLATKAELTEAVSGLATKTDLDRMEGRLTTAIGLIQRDSFSRLDQHEVRISKLEN